MNRSIHKRGKFGQLPGSLSKRLKIRMLESREPFSVSPWQEISVKSISTYRNNHYKKLKKRFRKGNKIDSRSFEW